jgi:Domain of unknown function (DUF5668)/B-box zinc finger
MNCATHPDTAAVAFCRTCGKPLCGTCTRDVRGVIYCEPCLAARLEGTAPVAGFVPPQTAYPQTIYPPAGGPAVVGAGPATRTTGPNPNPAVAGILAGFFPFGVGAVYCSQYAKGLAHLVIFVLLIVASNQAGEWGWIFGLGVAFFWVYQIIDAVRTAHALQAGQPAPDPMGLGQTFSMGEKFDTGKVPIGAIVLIGVGVLFLLHTMGMNFAFERFWPLLLIVVGGWLFYRQRERAQRICTCGRCSTRWLMGPAMVLTTGILFLMQSLNIAYIDRTWPAWILVVGIVKLVQSSASTVGHVGPLPSAPPAVAPPIPPPSFSNPSPSNQPPASSSGEVRNV